MDNGATATLDDIEKLTGARPPMCPWRSLSEPFVGEVLDLYRACGGGTEAGAVPSRVLTLDPPHKVWRGLLHYTQAVQLIRAHDMQRAREERERQAATGAVPQGVKRTIARG